jgi:hypothetical protein
MNNLETFIKTFAATNMDNLFSDGENLTSFCPYATFQGAALPSGQFSGKDALRAILIPPEPQECVMPGIPEAITDGIRVDAELLYGLLPWAAKQDIRYYLNGILIDGNKAVATDGHVLRAVDYPLALDNPIIISRDIIEYGKKFKAESFLVRAPWINASGLINSGAVSFQAGSVFCQDVGINGKFPEYDRVIPTEQPLHTVKLPSLKTAKEFAVTAKKLNSRLPVIALCNNHINAADGTELFPLQNSLADGIDWSCQAKYFVLACEVGGELCINNKLDAAFIKNDNSVSVLMSIRK